MEDIDSLRRGLSNRCSLYSTGPSCGSALSLVTPRSFVGDLSMDSGSPYLAADDLAIEDPPVRSQGEVTRRGTGSKVKTDAMFTVGVCRQGRAEVPACTRPVRVLDRSTMRLQRGIQ